MKPSVTVSIDGHTVSGTAGQSVLEAALSAGIELPHLCACKREGYLPIATCRTCLVDIEGREGLTPACREPVKEGMIVRSDTAICAQTRRLVVELLLSEMSESAKVLHFDSPFLQLAERVGADRSRFGHRPSRGIPDRSHPAMTVDPDACIRCGLCRSACQDVQVNGVIGLAGRGEGIHVAFDAGTPMGDSSCASCGECVQVCPTGALAFSELLNIGGRDAIEQSGETVCPFCSVGCRVDIHIAEDRVIWAEGVNGPANRGRLCVKGRFGFSYLRHPDRLTTPLIRRDDAPKLCSHNLTGSEVLALFRPASWEEALDRAADGFKRLRDIYGGDTLGVLGSAKATNEDAYILQKLARTGFGSAHIDHCTRLCASVPPLAEATGFSAVTVPIEQIADADVVLMVGSNPDVNHPVAASFMKNAIRRGTKLILVDPYQQSMARLATIHLRISPSTDVPLLSAMTRIVVTEGLHDRRFVEDRLEGFDELVQRIDPYTPEMAGRICGVAPEAIVEAARLFAMAPSAMCFWGMGASQHVHGADNIRAAIAFALVCGQIGRPGAGLHPLRGQNNVQGSCDAGLLPNCFPGYHSVDDPAIRSLFKQLWQTQLPVGQGLSVVEILDAVRTGRIRGLYVVGGNPAMANPDLATTRESLSRLGHLVVQDIFPTETAAFADVILPAAALAERSGTVTNTDRIVQIVEPAISPPGLAQEDWTITCAIAARLGLPWANTSPEEIFDEMAAVVPVLEGLSWAKLKNERHARYPLNPNEFGLAKHFARTNQVHDSLFATVFPRGVRAKLATLDDRRPAELPDDDFPFTLITGRVREHWHTGSMTRRAEVLDALSPEALIHICPIDFDRLGLSGDRMVTLETRRGAVSAYPVSDKRLQIGVVWMAMSFSQAPANELTINKRDQFTKVPEYKFCAARIVQQGSTNHLSENRAG